MSPYRRRRSYGDVEGDFPSWLESLERIIFPNARGDGVAPNMEHLLFINNDLERPTGYQLRAIGQNLNLKSFHLINRPGYNFLVGMTLNELLQKMPNLESYSGESCYGIEKLSFIRTLDDGSFSWQLVRTEKANIDFLNKLECVTLADVPPPVPGSERQQWRQVQPPLSLDPLQNLKCFYIWGSEVVDSFNFLQNADNLEVLKINLMCYEKRKEANYKYYLQKRHLPPLRNFVEHATSPTMNGLQLEGMVHLEIDFRFSANNLQVLKEWMPNLVVLKTILNDDTFPVVCREWSTTLRELALLFGSDISDEAVVGSSMKDPSKDKQRGSNITNLEDLRVFSFDAYCNQSRVGDASVVHGFLQMARLTNLRICVSAQMNEEAATRLERELQCVELIYNFGPGPHFGNDCCGRLDFYYDAVEGARPPQPEPEPEPEVPIQKRLRRQI